jgi:hypothetical protein
MGSAQERASLYNNHRRALGSGLGEIRGLIVFERIALLRLIARRMRQRFLVIENRSEIAHIEPTAAGFAFVKMLSLVDRLRADALADDFPARDRRCHARDLGHRMIL